MRHHDFSSSPMNRPNQEVERDGNKEFFHKSGLWPPLTEPEVFGKGMEKTPVKNIRKDRL